MNPTPRLRWIERQTGKWILDDVLPHREFTEVTKRQQTVRVLQQWYAYDINYPMTRGEWKDVPTEKEEQK